MKPVDLRGLSISLVVRPTKHAEMTNEKSRMRGSACSKDLVNHSALLATVLPTTGEPAPFHPSHTPHPTPGGPRGDGAPRSPWTVGGDYNVRQPANGHSNNICEGHQQRH
ncbi:hypothetical protein VPH35_092764 [Triticum aestivum]